MTQLRLANAPSAAHPARFGGVAEAGVVVLVPLAAAALWALLHTPHGLVILLAMVAALIVPGVAAVSILRRRPRAVTPADRVTLGRVGLTGVVAAATVLVLAGSLPARTWVVAAVIGAALLLDAIDGWVARSTGTATDAGARLDMESDAALLLVLSILAAPTAGWWVLAIGAMRYVFVAASWIRPKLRGDLPYSSFRRTVAAIQGVALLVALIPIVPVPLAAASAAIALVLLAASFGRDIIALERA
ncbi:CDP-alcohol phosphatidyltransferase family protein [Microbacterium aurantiacum]|uniref:CDP-alcohol phosphatidyltransferase family protein n=1 Tax=Microbacterium aurantiacum TaxID=162393 RepID=UPI001F3CFCF0|nr:CDP-alcohol phosphatidyltransferase family protein [Microbacterium aurantiacum]